jgi:hypothetical protein
MATMGESRWGNSSYGDIDGVVIALPRKVADEVKRELRETVGDVLQPKRQLFSLGSTLGPSGASKTEYLADHHSVHDCVREFEPPVQRLCSGAAGPLAVWLRFRNFLDAKERQLMVVLKCCTTAQDAE